VLSPQITDEVRPAKVAQGPSSTSLQFVGVLQLVGWLLQLGGDSLIRDLA